VKGVERRKQKRSKWPGNRFPGKDAERLIESVNATAFFRTDPFDLHQIALNVWLGLLTTFEAAGVQQALSKAVARDSFRIA
jgi:hypothetical protein